MRSRPPSIQARLAVVLLVGTLAWGCGDDATPGSQSGGPGVMPAPIVNVGWLAERLDDPDVQIVDARTQAAEFEAGHVPGALRLDPFELSAVVDGIPAQIAPVSVAEPILRERGLRGGTTVVVYGKPPEFDPVRVQWALRYFGHRDVRYLDGGYDAWVGAGQAVETGPSRNAPSDYAIGGLVGPLRVTGDWVLEQLGDPPYAAPAIQIIDARAPEEFEAGRIPSSRLLPWSTNLSDGLLLPRSEIEALHAGRDASTTTVVYCLAGWRASFAWLVLTSLGFDDVRVYDGSWFEWGEGGRFPIETDAGVS